jgi:hypothetical protein
MSLRTKLDHYTITQMRRIVTELALPTTALEQQVRFVRKPKGAKLHVRVTDAGRKQTFCGIARTETLVDERKTVLDPIDLCANCSSHYTFEHFFPDAYMLARLVDRLGQLGKQLDKVESKEPTWALFADLAAWRSRSFAEMYTSEIAQLEEHQPELLNAVRSAWKAATARREALLATWREALIGDPASARQRLVAAIVASDCWLYGRRFDEKHPDEIRLGINSADAARNWSAAHADDSTLGKHWVSFTTGSFLREHELPVNRQITELAKRTPCTEATANPVTWLQREWKARITERYEAINTFLHQEAASLTQRADGPVVLLGVQNWCLRKPSFSDGVATALALEMSTIVVSSDGERAVVFCDPLVATWWGSTVTQSTYPIKVDGVNREIAETAACLWAPYENDSALSDLSAAWEAAEAILA